MNIKKLLKRLKKIDHLFLEKHIADFHDYSQDHLMYKYMCELTPHQSISDTFEYFKKLINDDMVNVYPILLDESKVIGTVSMRLENKLRGNWSIGFASSSLYWGLPTIPLTVSAAIGLSIEKYNANRIEGLTQSNNTKSQKLFKGLGFKEEGVKRSFYRDKNTGKFLDAKIYGLLCNEFVYLKRLK